MRHPWWIRSFAGIPVSSVAERAKTCQFTLTKRLQELPGSRANGPHVRLEAVTREYRQYVNWARAIICR